MELNIISVGIRYNCFRLILNSLSVYENGRNMLKAIRRIVVCDVRFSMRINKTCSTTFSGNFFFFDRLVCACHRQPPFSYTRIWCVCVCVSKCRAMAVPKPLSSTTLSSASAAPFCSLLHSGSSHIAWKHTRQRIAQHTHTQFQFGRRT